MDTLLQNAVYATSTFASTTGFSATGTIAWATTTIKVYVGGITYAFTHSTNWIAAGMLLFFVAALVVPLWRFFRY